MFASMENFITGYPGHESQYRAAMLKALGQERYDFFFDKFLECFFTDTDARFFASKRLNLLRLPFNYRHFEDDMNPRVLKTSGFKHLDRVIDICAVHNIYTILDMHTVPVREVEIQTLKFLAHAQVDSIEVRSCRHFDKEIIETKG